MDRRRLSHPSSKGQDLQEAQLVEACRAGDHDAFRELYEANVDRIYRLTYRMAGDDDLARDYTQEAFVRAYQKLNQFRGDSTFSTWLGGAAPHGVGRHFSARKGQRELALLVGAVQGPAGAPFLREHPHRGAVFAVGRPSTRWP